ALEGFNRLLVPEEYDHADDGRAGLDSGSRLPESGLAGDLAPLDHDPPSPRGAEPEPDAFHGGQHDVAAGVVEVALGHDSFEARDYRRGSRVELRRIDVRVARCV